MWTKRGIGHGPGHDVGHCLLYGLLYGLSYGQPVVNFFTTRLSIAVNLFTFKQGVPSICHIRGSLPFSWRRLAHIL